MADAGNAYLQKKVEEEFEAEFAELLKPAITVGGNGNWYVDGGDTGTPARGPQGIQGEKGASGDNPFTDIISGVVIPVSAWQSSTDYSAAGYGYKATVSNSHITETTIADVLLAPAGGLEVIAPFANTGAGNISFYASAVPSRNITVERISLRERGMIC